MQVLLRLLEILLEITIAYLPFGLLTIKAIYSDDASFAVTTPKIIPPTTVQPPRTPVDLSATYSNRVHLTSNKTSLENPIVLPGMAYQIASSPHAHVANTGVPYAVSS